MLSSLGGNLLRKHTLQKAQVAVTVTVTPIVIYELSLFCNNFAVSEEADRMNRIWLHTFALCPKLFFIFEGVEGKKRANFEKVRIYSGKI